MVTTKEIQARECYQEVYNAALFVPQMGQGWCGSNIQLNEHQMYEQMY